MKIKSSKKIWFRHEALTGEEADNLLEEYKKKGYQVGKMLNVDPKLWDVAVKLQFNEKPQKTPPCMVNRCWQCKFKKTTRTLG